MKSGLEDRNNLCYEQESIQSARGVSMKSGLEDRNNVPASGITGAASTRLNEDTRRTPEQSQDKTEL